MLSNSGAHPTIGESNKSNVCKEKHIFPHAAMQSPKDGEIT